MTRRAPGRVARGAITLAALAAAPACGDNRGGGDVPDGGGPAPLCTGGWHVCGGQLRDADGRAVILRGLNVSGGNKQAPYLDFHVEADLARMRDDWGMNAIRWVMPWAAVEPTEGGYDDAYLDAVRIRLDWAAAHDLVVILDMHQDVYGEGFGFNGAPRWTCDEARYADFRPRTPWALNYVDPNVVACFDELWTDPAKGAAHAAAWAHVAARLGDHPAVVGFDPINEPHWGSYAVSDFEADRLQPFYDRDVAAVRAEAPGWVVFAEPASSRNLGFPTSLARFGYPDVVYAPHAYDATAEQGNGFDPARRDSFMANIAALRDEADRLGAALWIGEYGGLGSDPGIGAYMAAAYDGAAAVAASSMYWDYSRGGGYAPIDADGAEVTAITDAIVRPYPSRIAGDPVAWQDDPAAGTLRLTYRPDPRIAAATEVIVPPRLLGAGGADAIDVACGGCTVAIAGDIVRLTTAPPADADGTATVVVTYRR
ncbi:MAG: cellulase family glycosylhydrolase [Kofleriaceae bacterium]|nr:cellulase family glycosylhydrolase [Kofleriaceae bacterium]MCB9571658.1 cellulase family glycosylhydrolase [Kofleriaceae bacterium]